MTIVNIGTAFPLEPRQSEGDIAAPCELALHPIPASIPETEGEFFTPSQVAAALRAMLTQMVQ